MVVNHFCGLIIVVLLILQDFTWLSKIHCVFLIKYCFML